LFTKLVVAGHNTLEISVTSTPFNHVAGMKGLPPASSIFLPS